MKTPKPRFKVGSLLLIFLLVLLQLGQNLSPSLAALPSANESASVPTKNAAPDTVPAALSSAAPNAVAITAGKIDGIAVDNDLDGRVDPGDTISYTVTITNTGTTDATGVNFSDTLDPNTTLVARLDYVSPHRLRRQLHRRRQHRPGRRRCRSRIPTSASPRQRPARQRHRPRGGTFTLTAFDATSAQGGTVSVNTDGTFTYLPPTRLHRPRHVPLHHHRHTGADQHRHRHHHHHRARLVCQQRPRVQRRGPLPHAVQHPDQRQRGQAARATPTARTILFISSPAAATTPAACPWRRARA